MSLLILVTAALFSMLPAAASNTDGCLPPDIQPGDVVSVEAVPSGPHRAEVKTITVAKKLKELRARCRKRKLVDAKGREIRIYRLLGCWGNPPDDYQEQLARQSRELASLRKRYRVIEVQCIPSGPQISQVRPELNMQKPDR
jgi:hypothetical protein